MLSFPQKITKIGILDSGIGGLAVLRLLINSFPAEYYYFADIKNLPYGAKSKRALLDITINNVEYLLSCNVQIIILACHTLSVTIFDSIKSKFPHVIFIDVARPIIQQSLKISSNKKIGIIATVATIKSNFYKKEFFSFDPEIQLFQYTCPNLASLIEQLPTQHPTIKNEVKKIILAFKNVPIDTLILGCTHYEWVKEIISDYDIAKIVSIENEFFFDFIKNNFIFTKDKSSIQCILSRSNLADEKRFYHFLTILQIPFLIKKA